MAARRRFDTIQHQFSEDTASHLQGSWTPVKDEITATHLTASHGTIPIDLDGQFIRLGANPHFHYQNQPYNFFDGDGHLHSTEFRDGCVTYSNRWVHTWRHLASKLHGKDFADFAEIAVGNMTPGERTIDENRERMGRANTAMVYHAGRALVLEENDKPYRVHLPGLETMGRLDFDGKLKHTMTAHPKADPVTGEMYFFGYHLRNRPPWLHFSVVKPDGKLDRTFPIDLDCRTMMHDMAMTENHCIILDHPLHFRPERMAKPPPKGHFPNPWVLDQVPSRFGVMRKGARSQEHITWFTGKTCMTFHVAASWEEGDRIYLWGTPSDDSVIAATTPDPESDPKYRQHWHQWVFNLQTGKTEVDESYELDSWVEFPQSDRFRMGRKTRYLYAALMIHMHTPHSRIPGVAKLDVVTKEQKVHLFPEYMWGGEFVFAPRVGRSFDDEDAGYLVGYVTHEATRRSEMYIVDAKTMECVCRIPTPRMVPMGLHSYWFERDEIMKQRLAL